MGITRGRIIIDIGHGWYAETAADKGRFDPGVVLPCGTNEFMLNSAAAAVVMSDLLAKGHHVEFVPLGLPLFERGRKAAGFDAFLSIHHNALNGRAQGAEACVHETKGTDADERLASTIAQFVSSELKITDRKVLRSPLAVLSGARKSNPRAAVLSEGFFMDAPGIDMFGWARREGKAIATAIHTWLSAC